MSKILSIGTANPSHRHDQSQILTFMQTVYAFGEADKRKLRFLYNNSGISSRYSVIPDYSLDLPGWEFFPKGENLEPFPTIEPRLKWYDKFAPALSAAAINDCVAGRMNSNEITHLITVSCTGMSAPGLDLQLVELLNLPLTTNRTSVNFMGCYAAIHALKMANDICTANPVAKVMIVCTELCTLHFQRDAGMDSVASALLFGDGSAAVLVTGDNAPDLMFDGNTQKSLHLDQFYSEIVPRGKKDMTWEISSSGFLMTLSNYIPELIEHDFLQLVTNALKGVGLDHTTIDNWCIHPGGKRILEAVSKSLDLPKDRLQPSYDVMKEYGNMSSPTILFVLKQILEKLRSGETPSTPVFGAAFGPGLTMETFVASY
ncbi:MAG: type III polyketide synthase [Chitinophagaceae bacterium]|nr:MAG: type III polyketide synthase [Chitinophagaceae bacterium]